MYFLAVMMKNKYKVAIFVLCVFVTCAENGYFLHELHGEN